MIQPGPSKGEILTPKPDKKPGLGAARGPAIQSLDKALRILLSFDSDRPELGVTDLSIRLGQSKSAVSKVLATFEHHGLVQKSAVSGHYRIGPRAYTIGQLFQPAVVIREQASPLLRALALRSGNTAQLSILLDSRVLVIASEESLAPIRFVARVGAEMPWYASASGKAAATMLTDERIRRLIDQETLRAFTPTTVTDPGQLLEQILRARSLGYAIVQEEWHPGLYAVAVPVASQAGPGAMVITGPTPFHTLPAFGELLESLRSARDQLKMHLEGRL